MIVDLPRYDGSILRQRLSAELLKKNLSREGNCVGFVSPVVLMDNFATDHYKAQFELDRVINFVWQLPEVSKFAGVVFQKLYMTILANGLAGCVDKSRIEVDNDSITIHQEHMQSGVIQLEGKASIQTINKLDDVVMGHVGIIVEAGTKAFMGAYSTKMSSEFSYHFLKSGINSFYNLARDCFQRSLET